MNSESPRPYALSSTASSLGVERPLDSTIAWPPRRTAVCGSALTRLITSVSATGQPSRAQARVTADTCGNTVTRSGAVQPDQGAADAVQQRVAAGQHVHLGRAVVEQAAQRGQQRRRPLPAFRADGVVEQAQLPVRSVNDGGAA
ncbi:hypothetical protein C1Y40_04375 [Mycobacterium talmoniae]|uniref:Uncharacterized protein n=1 Tax=Mycobacterium talmoniae TaxID=1858794 RepID=A0A2S8BFK7_9MYCO|nr:hypothetical protein C1Y40_04375 [Mycobacterium talmoniae]